MPADVALQSAGRPRSKRHPRHNEHFCRFCRTRPTNRWPRGRAMPRRAEAGRRSIAFPHDRAWGSTAAPY